MYKLSYYRFAEASLMTTGQLGFDRVRNAQIGNMDIELEYFEEVRVLCQLLSVCLPTHPLLSW
jgi:hypothetical protein